MYRIIQTELSLYEMSTVDARLLLIHVDIALTAGNDDRISHFSK
jgi:hypothetical protein